MYFLFFKQTTAMGKGIITALLLFFIIPHLNAQLGAMKLIGKDTKDYKMGFGAFVKTGIPVTDGSDVTLEIGANIFLLNDGYRDADGTIMCPLKAGYRYTVNGTGEGFYIEPQVGYNLYGITSLRGANGESIDLKYHGAIRVTQAFIDLLQKSAEPRIVNVSSSVGSLSVQSDPNWQFYDQAKYTVYASSKSALNMYTVMLAYELRETPFKVNAVDPGYAKTDFNHHSGPGTVEDAATRVVKYALIDNDGPTGKYFSEETNPEGGEIGW